MKFTYLSTVSFLTIALLISAPLMVIAQETEEILEAKADAREAANIDVGSASWFAAGFCFGILGVGFAALHDPGIDPARFIGKSPQYVAVYTNTYNRVATKKRLVSSSIGCVGMNIFWSSVYVGLVGAAAAANSTY